ncbi:MAG: hypothetical protein ACRD9S_06945 [Pyrinomonadaceae bacterium]
MTVSAKLPSLAASYASSYGFKTILALLVACGCFTLACSTGSKPVAEAPPAPIVKTEAPAPELAKVAPPELNQVQEAVKRVFKEAAVVDSSQKPAFVAGDFNGDLSQDIAVLLKPAPEKISDLNEEFPTWILRDPFGTPEARSPRLRVAATETLLAVIHGYGSEGWRDPQATQTYLLKNAAGSGMETQAGKEFVTANKGKTLPTVRGDLIAEVLDGKTGYLYYAGATYAWYDPKTFTGEPDPRRSHGAAEQRMKK